MTRCATNPAVCLFILAVVGCVMVGGCARSLLRSDIDTSSLDQAAKDESRLIGAYTHPHGMNYVKVESVGLVTGLAGTGSDPAPNSHRAALLEEMKRHKVPNPNQMLAADSTSLVVVTGLLRPGIRKGDTFDLDVRTTSRSETSSLRGSWLMPARLSEHAVLSGRVKKGHTLASAVGAVLVDPGAAEDEALATKGRVLGGGTALKDRPMGLIISHEGKSVRLAKEIAAAINERFHTYKDRRKTGIATPKTDEYIELLLHPQYNDNIPRFIKVVRNIAIRESEKDRVQRLGRLERQLDNPLTTATAALRLEAIGTDAAVEALAARATSGDPEIRFYAAEALAYLDNTAGVAPLAEAARNEPAFRVHALAALSAMQDVMAYEALRSLLDVRSAETRYGAFRSLWSMTPDDALVKGQRLGDQFSYHVLDVGGPPMIHVTRSFRPEIVLFGADQHLKLPLFLDAGKLTMINGQNPGDGGPEQITVSRFSDNRPTERRVVSTSVDEVIRAVMELGGTYPDVVQALQQAKRSGALTSSLRIDALPETGRSYTRGPAAAAGGDGQATDGAGGAPADDDNPIDPDDLGATPYKVATPVPDLFKRKK